MRLHIVFCSALAACSIDRADSIASIAQPTGVPEIEDAFSCSMPPPIGGKGVVGEVGLPAAGTDMQSFSLSMYPDATCNDGSSAILYYRPGTGMGIHSWLIELAGGGACATAQDCAERWCSIGTAFGRQQMGSGDYLTYRPTIAATGIQSLTSASPFAQYNHVLIHYCSSDAWTGTSPSVIGPATDPNTGVSVTFSTRFNGDAILTAALRALRRDGATITGMPDLDEATGDVVIAGGSAGGTGVIFQLDRTVTYLSNNHDPGSQASYFGIIDSAFPPALENLGFQFTGSYNSSSGNHWEDYVDAKTPYFARVTDDSCPSFHLSDPFKCYDETHVIANHITTPTFVRQGEPDKLLSKNYRDDKLAPSPLSPLSSPTMSQTDFATLVYPQARNISNWPSTAEEPPSKGPGAFIPNCQTHDPTHNPQAWFLTTIGTFPSTQTWLQTWMAWRTGGALQRIMIDDPSASTSVCQCAPGTGPC